MPPVIWRHNSDGQPIGPHTEMYEDSKGLLVTGQLLVKDVQRAREAYALMKSKTIRGMSIGYSSRGEELYNGKQVNERQEPDLWECSIVTFPANVEAMVSNVKSIIAAGGMPTLREFEDLLRDAGRLQSEACPVDRQERVCGIPSTAGR